MSPVHRLKPKLTIFPLPTLDAVVADVFSALPESFRQVVALVDVEGLSYQEAAERLSIPVGTVMSRLHRSRARMRHRLESAGLAHGKT
jgi:RNA polymerase sigma-70 factor (ECF subfamily)